ncbi:Secreted protein acidic and rich in cysteine Ca binding region [Parelaphostrongylus tenuis]|uniref:Secreted protein acidic and rich in cysteine Ca binding region n=1 Tax=Parelaphostrongylus tenuis TaxID=148309 RepID=A0AAD5WKV2_PARTN|nr:Secreted protein acidic and rich in cysteine Ca binding region [Parelaphostrongylus tenuis]
MRVLLSFTLLQSVIGTPRLAREANPDVEHTNNPLALNSTRNHISPNALFIPHGEEPKGFDPRKPIQGAFFVGGDTTLNMAKFRFPQKALTSAYTAAATTLTIAPPALEPAALALAHANARTPSPSTQLTSENGSEPLPEQHTIEMMSPFASALDEQRLIITTQTMPTVSVAGQKSASTTTTSQPSPIVSIMVPVDKNVDLDSDGRLSLSEVQYAAFVHHGLSGSVVQGLFNEVDRNKDGFLDSVEFDNIRPLVLAKAENAALRYMQSVDTDKNKLLSLEEAQAYILKEHGIGSRDVERVWRLVIPSTSAEMDALQFSKLRRRIRGMDYQIGQTDYEGNNADMNGDGHISLDEAQAIAFEQEGIGAGE